MGSSDQNETRKEHELRDMPPLGPMQKKSRVSEQIVAWGYFSPDFASVLVPGLDYVHSGNKKPRRLAVAGCIPAAKF